MGKNRRVVLEVNEDLHNEIRKLAFLNNVKIYALTNAVIEDFLKDQDHVKTLIKRLQL